MRLHHPYLNDEGGGIGKNHMDKCQQDRLMYQMLIAIRSERVDRSKICSGKAHVLKCFGPGFIETSPARRRMIDSLSVVLHPDFVYNFLCVHRPRQEDCLLL